MFCFIVGDQCHVTTVGARSALMARPWVGAAMGEGSTEIIYKVTYNIDMHVLNRTGMVASVSVRDVTHNIAQCACAQGCVFFWYVFFLFVFRR
jgi:hypothetical protein